MSEAKGPIEAILFDMDGTLLDTEALSDKALLMAFGESLPQRVFEQPPMSNHRIPWELKKQLLGLRGTEWAPITIDYAKEHWGVSDDEDGNSDMPPPPAINDFIAAWEQHLSDMCEEIEACKGAVELVANLAKHHPNIPMAIATSSRESGVAKKRKRHETTIFRHMKTIVTGDVVAHGKPAPDIYLEAAKRLNVDPAKCLVFEDALSGIRSGKAAGCYVVAIPDNRFSKEELSTKFEPIADVVVEDLTKFDGSRFGLQCMDK